MTTATPNILTALITLTALTSRDCWWFGPELDPADSQSTASSPGDLDPMTTTAPGTTTTGHDTTYDTETQTSDTTSQTSDTTSQTSDTTSQTSDDTGPLPACMTNPALLVDDWPGLPVALYQAPGSCDVLSFVALPKLMQDDEVTVQLIRTDLLPEEYTAGALRAAAISKDHMSAIVVKGEQHSLRTWNPLDLQVIQSTDLPWPIDAMVADPGTNIRLVAGRTDDTLYIGAIDDDQKIIETSGLPLEAGTKPHINALYPGSSQRVWLAGRTDDMSSTDPFLVLMDLNDPLNNAEIDLSGVVDSTEAMGLSAILVDNGTVYAAGYAGSQPFLLTFADAPVPKIPDYNKLGALLGGKVYFKGLLRVGDTLVLVGYETNGKDQALLYKIPIENPANPSAVAITCPDGCKLSAVAAVPGSDSSFLVAGETTGKATFPGFALDPAEPVGFVGRLTVQ